MLLESLLLLYHYSYHSCYDDLLALIRQVLVLVSQWGDEELIKGEGWWMPPCPLKINEALRTITISYATALTDWIQALLYYVDTDHGCWLDRNSDHHHCHLYCSVLT